MKKLITICSLAGVEPAVKSAIDAQGMILAPSTRPEYLAKFMAREIPRWRELIEKLGIPRQ